MLVLPKGKSPKHPLQSDSRPQSGIEDAVPKVPGLRINSLENRKPMGGRQAALRVPHSFISSPRVLTPGLAAKVASEKQG